MLIAGLAGILLAEGCARWFPEHTPVMVTPAEVKRYAFDVVARENRCEPSVLAVDREGRAVILTFQVASIGKEHYFLIPDLGVRVSVPAGTTATVQVLADRSGIYDLACNSQRWIGPFATEGKLAIK
jgi:heme/copper-type cytochrome/quinol oxidase subunit 2